MYIGMCMQLCIYMIQLHIQVLCFKMTTSTEAIGTGTGIRTLTFDAVIIQMLASHLLQCTIILA